MIDTQTLKDCDEIQLVGEVGSAFDFPWVAIVIGSVCRHAACVLIEGRHS